MPDSVALCNALMEFLDKKYILRLCCVVAEWGEAVGASWVAHDVALGATPASRGVGPSVLLTLW